MIFLTFRFLAIAFARFFSSQTNYLASIKHLLDFFPMAPPSTICFDAVYAVQGLFF